MRLQDRSDSSKRALAVLLTTTIVLAWVVAACSQSEGPAGVIITNDLSSTVRLTYVVRGTETLLSSELHGDRILPGEMKEFTLDLFDKDNPTGCSRGDVVARSESGVELARIPPPLCGGRIPVLSTWEVAPASG